MIEKHTDLKCVQVIIQSDTAHIPRVILSEVCESTKLRKQITIFGHYVDLPSTISCIHQTSAVDTVSTHPKVFTNAMHVQYNTSGTGESEKSSTEMYKEFVDEKLSRAKRLLTHKSAKPCREVKVNTHTKQATGLQESSDSESG